MSLEIIKKDLASNQIPPVYLWYGEDRYSIAEALKLLKDYIRAEDPSGSGIEVFSGEGLVAAKVIEAAYTSSFFARRLVIVDDLPYFKKDKAQADGNEEEEPEADSASTGKENEDVEAFLAYCENPNPATCLLLISEKVNKGRKLYKAIAKAGKVLQFSYPDTHSEWIKWIQKEVESRGKKVNSRTASFLLEWAGHHTGILNRELDKLVLYIGARQEIRQEDIEAVCVPLIETTIFTMLDAIAAGKTGVALQKLKEVLSQEYHLKVYAMIVRQIRLLLAASILRRRGETVEEFMKVAGIKKIFEGNKIYRQAAHFAPQNLAEALEDCLETEIALKNSGGNPHLLLEMMVIRFCQKSSL
ncbi:MAG TPA: DNA polymerase III subunit delta [Peptococcaceae bacterium]|nr:DNA polymerase III subunit delta [Peptococcaceae bacterium]